MANLGGAFSGGFQRGAAVAQAKYTQEQEAIKAKKDAFVTAIGNYKTQLGVQLENSLATILADQVSKNVDPQTRTQTQLKTVQQFAEATLPQFESTIASAVKAQHITEAEGLAMLAEAKATFTKPLKTLTDEMAKFQDERNKIAAETSPEAIEGASKRAGAIKTAEEQAKNKGINVQIPEEMRPLIGPIQGDLTETQLAAIQNYNLSGNPQLAMDLAAGNIKTVTDPVEGGVTLVNRRSQESKRLGQTPSIPPSPEVTNKTGLVEAVGEAAGPTNWVSKKLSNIFGFMMPGSNPSLTAEAKVERFNKSLEQAFVNNPKFPVAEMERIKGMLPDVKSAWIDPDAQVQIIYDVRDELVASQERDRTSLRGDLSLKRRREIMDNINTRDNALALIGNLPERGDLRIYELAEKISSGTATDEEYDEFERLESGK